MVGAEIFVVDDDPLVCRVLSELLELEGYRVVTFTDPERALAAVPTARPDAVITDFNMPHVSGTELWSSLQRSMGRRMPSLILISGALHDVPKRSLERFDAWLPKPVESEELLAVVEACVRFRAALRSGVRTKQAETDQRSSCSGDSET